MTTDKLVFGIVITLWDADRKPPRGEIVRVKAESMSFVSQMSATDLDPDEWDWVCWYRAGRLFGIIQGSIRTRALVRSVDGCQVVTLGAALDEMQSVSNRWLDPVTHPRRGSAVDQATSLVTRWIGEMWAPSEDDEPEDVQASPRRVAPDTERPRLSPRGGTLRRHEAPAEDRTPTEVRSPRRRPEQTGGPVAATTVSQTDILRGMKLLGATDEEGGGFTFRKVKPEGSDTEE